MRPAATEADAALEQLRGLKRMQLRLLHNVKVTGDRQARPQEAYVFGRPSRPTGYARRWRRSPR